MIALSLSALALRPAEAYGDTQNLPEAKAGSVKILAGTYSSITRLIK